jgi:polyhydroxyalkanoate synthesis regulator phasin
VRDEIRRVVLITSGVVELTRNRAEAIVRDLIKSDELPGGQATQVVKDLMERSKQNRTEILNLVRSEMRNQIQAIGLASKRDIERLERRIARLEDRPTAPTTVMKSHKKTPKKTHKKSPKKTHKKTAKKTTERRDDEG